MADTRTVLTLDRPRRITAACATGEHRTCIGTVYVWPMPDTGPYFVVCECTSCRHVPPARRA